MAHGMAQEARLTDRLARLRLPVDSLKSEPPVPLPLLARPRTGAAMRYEAHQRQNTIDSVLIGGAIAMLLVASTYLLWGPYSALAAAAVAAAGYFLAPRLPARTVMALYRASPLDKRHGRQIATVAATLGERAGLDRPPALFVIQSATLNAFSTGSRDDGAIALTEGLLRKLTLRELAGVIAHEIAHIRNGDLPIMTLADILTRATHVASLAAVGVAAFYLPAAIAGEVRLPWLPILLLALAPTISSLLMLALSRSREFDADLDSVVLSGDAVGLASALAKLEPQNGKAIEDLLPPGGRRTPQPSLLRSHPTSAERIERLRAAGDFHRHPPLPIHEEPMVSLVGVGPVAMRPRFRLPGIWY